MSTARLYALTALMVGYVLAAPFAPFVSGRPMCPFRLLTGIPCLLCALTRSISYLLRGDLNRSLNTNVLGSVAVTGMGILCAMTVARLIRPSRECSNRA